MAPNVTATDAYTCPMHSDVRDAAPGKCPRCGMALVPQGARFALLQHMLSSPLHVVAMLVLMAVLMAAVMMVR